MTKNDMTKAATLLDALFTAAPAEARASQNENIFLAYSMALEAYDYEQVKQGILAYSRTSRMYPSVSEIVGNMPEDAKPQKEERHISHATMKPYVDRFTAMYEAKPSVSRYAREHGMTWEEAAAALGVKR